MSYVLLHHPREIVYLFQLFLLFFLLISPSYQHARLLEPPSRASMWRVGYPTPRDQDDNQAYCGGFGVQHNKNGGKCGICGDPWHQHPRAHESPGGIYANGIITKTYRQGSLIPVIVDVTANHLGYFIFKLCPNNDIFHDPDQSCFDAYPLTTGKGNSIKYPITDYQTGMRLLYVRLPLSVTCTQCILQWSYVGGNNWGLCANGSSGLGCGPQEMFRSCADIRITPHPLLSDASHEVVGNSAFHFEDDDETLAIDFTEIEPEYFGHLDERKSLLMKKRIILEKVLQKLQELILLTQEAEKQNNSQDGWYENLVDDLRSQASEQKIFSPDIGEDNQDSSWDRSDRNIEPERWWEKILSNRHK